ncbi:hypothetical protein J2X63_002863 [Agromyces sp. 3263]|uniref:anti-sigma factor n=1 Tax=Agromyces sp. 3263 TaxID=2817750 RepID=UPI00286010F1|nr:anti-sigma factor [Agromyces sp. 3263]MDR6907155.1 hypothetical protein [Agromyces sp. 3263]
MGHIEPDDLATLALDGVRPEGDTRAHLDTCDACRAEYEALARTVELGRTGAPRRGLQAPPSSVWAAIHEELSLAPELAADPLAADAVAEDALAPAPPEPIAAPPTDATRPAEEPPTATVTPLRGRRAQRWWPVAAAAAAVGIVAGIAIGAGVSGGFGTRPTPQTVVATAALDAFPGWSATGSAKLEEDDDGVRSIVVDLDAEVPSTDVREVWLIRSDASGLVSLGLLEGATGRFVVPDGIDLDEFTLVDVSAEPVDGDPAHSGDSIVRGELRRI